MVSKFKRLLLKLSLRRKHIKLDSFADLPEAQDSVSEEKEIPDKNNKRSLLKADKIYITDKMYVRIPTVGEILEDEQNYYNLITSLTATPFQYMVQLDDIGVDFTKITDYQLFMMLFPLFAQRDDMSILFGDIDFSDIQICPNPQNDTQVLYSKKNDVIIDEFIYSKIADAIRKINNLEREKRKPGNEEGKKRRLNIERRKQKRNANKPYEPYLENLIVALVNNKEFPYDYDSCMKLSMYRFNRSFKQIQHKTTFDNTMIGVYAGTVDTTKMKDKSCLSWIPVN